MSRSAHAHACVNAGQLTLIAGLTDVTDVACLASNGIIRGGRRLGHALRVFVPGIGVHL